MGKLILIVHTSLDGFVAGPGGTLDGFEKGEENLEFVCSLTESAGTALFGRISYQLLNSYWPTARDHPQATTGEIIFSNWYNQAKKIVFSKTLSPTNIDNTTIVNELTSDEIIKIKEQTNQDILLFGSPSITQVLMAHDLIDEYWICINPIIFGNGIPLFTTSGHTIKLRLFATNQFSNGEIAHHFIVQRS